MILIKNTSHIPSSIFAAARNNSALCLFCTPIDGMTLYQTQNFLILLDNFPITAGHILISSKKHYGSAGELDLVLIAELLEIKNYINSWAKSKLKKCIFYEHGRAGSCLAGETECDHFHLHCLPVDICIHSSLQKSFEHKIMPSYIARIIKVLTRWKNHVILSNY